MAEFLKRKYHWFIAAVVLLDMFLIGGINNNLSSLFLVPVTEGLEISRSSFAWAISMKSLASILSAILSGFLLKKLGYRVGASVFLLVGSGAMALMSLASGPWLLGIGAGLYGLTEGLCATSGAAYILGRWFHKGRGTVLGLVTAATGIGAGSLSFALSKVMDLQGWQGAYRLCAILLAAVCALMALVIREDPEKLGREAYGFTPDAKPEKEGAERTGLEWKRLWKTPAFLMLSGGLLLACTCVYFPFQTLVAHLGDSGLDGKSAVFFNSLLMVILACAKLGAGALSDKIGSKRVTGICLVAGIACLATMACVEGKASALVGVILLALSLPIGAILIPLLTTELFGLRAQRVYIGVFVAISNLANMLAGPIINGSYDRAGSYNGAYALGAGVIALALILFLVSFRLAAKEKKA